MIIAVDRKTGLAYYSATKSEIARLIGVTPRSLLNWEKKGNFINYDRYAIYFICKNLKSTKGFAISPRF